MGSVPKQLCGAMWGRLQLLVDGRTGLRTLQRELGERSGGGGDHSPEWKPEMTSGSEKRAEDRCDKRRKKNHGTA